MYEQEKNNNSTKYNTKTKTNIQNNNQKQHKQEKFNNISNNKKSTTNTTEKNDDDLDDDNTNGLDNNSRQNFQTIKYRTFDPSSEEDTNLLITKEILQDVTNRIEYNYENNNYLKKYIKHRVEEIVDINKLLDDE